MKFSSRRALQPGEKIRVLVVDDSAVIRRLVTRALEQAGSIEVAGTAADGAIALARIPQVNPDVLTLDIEMPVMNGMETLRRVRRAYPRIRVIMFSTLTERGAAATLDALGDGADDYVTKASCEASCEGSLDRSLARLREELVPRIEQFFEMPQPCSAATLSTSAAASPAQASAAAPRAVAIGVSTGGPAALTELLPAFPASFPLPILVVQHMPPLFTRLLAERLNGICPLEVAEAKDGDPVRAGRIYIAPGDFHMKVIDGIKEPAVHLDQSEPENSCRPAIDVLFASMGEVYGGATIPVILTGMGHDGLRGARILAAKGASLIAQDEASSVVWGMPGAAVRAGVAGLVAPLNRIAEAILKRAACA